jgi:hypothetical protein
MDTGPKVQGRLLDLYMWSCHEALAFGRQQIELTVLRLGWNPSASTPSLVDRLFRRREAAARTLPPPPPPPPVESALDAVSLDDEETTLMTVEAPVIDSVEPASAPAP